VPSFPAITSRWSSRIPGRSVSSTKPVAASRVASGNPAAWSRKNARLVSAPSFEQKTGRKNHETCG